MNAIRENWNRLERWKKYAAFGGLGVLVYALLGFFLIPALARHAVETTLPEMLRRPVSVGEIRCNPFLLTVDISDFAIMEPDGTAEFLGFDAIHADLELSSLFRLALVVREAGLHGPRCTLRLEKNGQFNFADLVSGTQDQATDNSTSQAIFPLIVEPFTLDNGTLTFIDAGRGATHVLDNIDVRIPLFSTRKKDWAEFVTPTLAFRLNGAPFTVEGKTKPLHNSLKTEFHIHAADLALPAYWHYVPAQPELSLTNGTLHLETTLAFEQFENKLPNLAVRGLAEGRNILLQDANGTALALPLLRVDMEDISILDQSVTLAEVRVERPFVRAELRPGGLWNWARYFSSPNATDSSRKTPANATGSIDPPPTGNGNETITANASAQTALARTETPALDLTIRAVRLTEGSLLFRDTTPNMGFAKTLSQINVTATNISTEANATGRIDLHLTSNGNETINANATLGLTPLRFHSDLRVAGLVLPAYAPYYRRALPLALNAGSLDAHLKIDIDEKGPRVTDSSLNVKGLRLDADKQAGQVQLQRLALDGISLDLAARSVRLGAVTLDKAEVLTAQDRQGRATLLAALKNGDTSPHAETSAPANASAWSIDARTLNLSDCALRISGKDERIPLFLHSLEAGPLSVHTGKRTAVLERLALRVGAALLRDQNGGLDLQALFAAPDAPGSATPTTTSGSPWTVTLKQMQLTNSSLDLTDTTSTVPLKLRVDHIALDAKNLSSDLGTRIPLSLSCRVDESGTVSATGTFRPHPLDGAGTLDISGLPLRLVAAPASNFAAIDIPSGKLDGKLQWALKPDGAGRVTGDLRATSLRVTELRAKTEIVAFDALRLRNLDLRLSPLALRIAAVELEKPRGAFAVDAQGKTTLDRITPTRSTRAPQKTPAADTDGLQALDIAAFTLKNGAFTFTDKSLSPHFTTAIAPVDLTLTDLSLDPDKRANLTLSALIGGAAPITATGWIAPQKTPFESNGTLTLRNLDLVGLSPYSAKFIAYPVTRGQLDWEIHLTAQDQKLAMGNAIKARKLELGDKVDSPDAADVPVKLGLALLRDMTGDISINLPVKGDLTDPKFSIGGIIVQAFLGLIVKAVASPFSLLASLVPGGGDQDMDKLPFPPGLVKPAPETLPTIDALAQILEQRPGLAISLTGHAAPDIDRRALEDARFLRKLQVIKYDNLPRAERKKSTPEDVEILPEEYDSLLWDAYKDEPVDKDKNALGIHRDVPREVQEAKLRELIHVTDEDIAALASARSEFVKNRLINDLNVDANRVFLGQALPLSDAPIVTVEIRQ